MTNLFTSDVDATHLDPTHLIVTRLVNADVSKVSKEDCVTDAMITIMDSVKKDVKVCGMYVNSWSAFMRPCELLRVALGLDGGCFVKHLDEELNLYANSSSFR